MTLVNDGHPVHPGEILIEDFLKPLGISRYRLAKSIGVPQRRIAPQPSTPQQPCGIALTASLLRLLLKHQIFCRYIPEVLVNMRVGGMSNASLGNRLKANRNDRKAWEVNGLKPYPWTL